MKKVLVKWTNGDGEKHNAQDQNTAETNYDYSTQNNFQTYCFLKRGS